MKRKGFLFGILVLISVCIYASSTFAYEIYAITYVSPVLYGNKGFYVNIDSAYLKEYSQLWFEVDMDDYIYKVPVESTHIYVPIKYNKYLGGDVFFIELYGKAKNGNTTYIDWAFPAMDSLYDIKSHSTVYEGSRSITVQLGKAKKGAVLKVKIGKKVYKKKLTSNKKKKIKVGIGRHKHGSRIEINLYYKGKLIGTDVCGADRRDHYYLDEEWRTSDDYDDEDDVVCYAKRPKRGMTKKQVEWTWGSPDDTASASGGWSYWYWDDGSYVAFRYGKVRSWYDAAG